MSRRVVWAINVTVGTGCIVVNTRTRRCTEVALTKTMNQFTS